MKRFYSVLAALVIPVAVVLAADQVAVDLVGKADTTSTNTTHAISGFVESIFIDVTGTTASTVTVATASETLLSVVVTADATYRPRILTHSTAGVVLGPSTNDYSRILLLSAPLTVTMAEHAAATNTCRVVIITDDK